MDRGHGQHHLGIEVVGVQANAEPVAQIKSMVDTKNYTWDMGKISQPAILLLQLLDLPARLHSGGSLLRQHGQMPHAMSAVDEPGAANAA